MRKFAAITISALIGLAPLSNIAAAQERAPKTKFEQQVSPRQKVKKQQWKKGGKYKGRGAVVTNYGRHKLRTPPKGHRWVRDGNDFILVAIGTGIITSIIGTAGQ